MATPRRRSARLSKTAQQQRASPRKNVSSLQLESLMERDETPEAGQPQSLDNVLATPASAATTKSQLSRLSALRTPQTEPRVERSEMHPGLMHHSTAKAPDSGLKLGFVDVRTQPPHTLASAQNTPSKARVSMPAEFSGATFDFKFGSDSQLSNEAQKLMDNVREEAARIKAQMQIEKEVQQKKDDEAEAAFGGVSGNGRKIAKPKGRAGRFSDIHMAQFKKMDSIANHPSAFRARPGFARPTAQSLKRSPSKAELDEPERPRTAGKGTPGRLPPPFLGRPTSVSPFKSIPSQSEQSGRSTPAKRARQSEFHDVSSARDPEQQLGTSTLPRPVSSSLLSPTKSSQAKSTSSHIPVASPFKSGSLFRSTSIKSLRTTTTIPVTRPSTSHGSTTAKPLMELPSTRPSWEQEATQDVSSNLSSPQPALRRSRSSTEFAKAATHTGFASKLPTFAGLKSILRPGRNSNAVKSVDSRPGTPKRPNTAVPTSDSINSIKKVDFTPSVKSRYAVKLAAGSPSPAKLPHVTPGKPRVGAVTYSADAYVLQEDEDSEEEGDWEDAGSEIEYPTLPEITSSPTGPEPQNPFEEKSKEYTRRESKEFKSIFTTLHHPSRAIAPSTLTSVNTIVNQTNPTTHANKVMRSPSSGNRSRPSPNTIRRVRSSGVSELVQPFEDTDVKTVPHGLPGKKRRRESAMFEKEQSTADNEKENGSGSTMPSVPGGWQEHSNTEEEQDEGVKRGGKRVRVTDHDDFNEKQASPQKPMSPVKKSRPSSAREVAKNNAKERKGILSLSRLNMLSRPKQRP